ncbi:MAG: hypothetical protein AAGG44_21110, partial [Planctomycetota bacterium]
DDSLFDFLSPIARQGAEARDFELLQTNYLKDRERSSVLLSYADAFDALGDIRAAPFLEEILTRDPRTQRIAYTLGKLLYRQPLAN